MRTNGPPPGAVPNPAMFPAMFPARLRPAPTRHGERHPPSPELPAGSACSSPRKLRTSCHEPRWKLGSPLLRSHDAGQSPFRPRACAAMEPTRTRWRMTLPSIAAKVAWIGRRVRPADAVVSMGEFSARNSMPRSLNSSTREMSELSDEAADPIEIEDDEDGVAAWVVEASGEVRPGGCGAGGTILERKVQTTARYAHLAQDSMKPRPRESPRALYGTSRKCLISGSRI